jgi:hypothetical protein
MKNILICHRPGGAFGYISDGWYNCLKQSGFNVRRWNSDISSWREFKPDLYIGCSAHRQPIPSDDNCIFSMHVNPYGPIDCGSINEPHESIEYVSETVKPSVVFGYGFDEDEIYWRYWNEKLKIRWVPMPTALDKISFYQNRSEYERPTDVIYVGGKWPYKGINIDAYLIYSMNQLKPKNIKFDIYGWGEWESGISNGIISDNEINSTFNMAKVGPCISEPHTQKWGFDLPERIWKISACNVLPIHDPVPTLRRVLPELPMAKDPESYRDLIEYYINNDNERISLSNKLRSVVIKEHSYHNRISRLFSEIGWKEESEVMLNGSRSV